jgi:hypothetical protein
MWTSYALLALLRAGLAAWLGIEPNRLRVSSFLLTGIELRPISTSVYDILLAVAVISLLTGFNAAYTAAIGTLGSMVHRNGIFSLGISYTIRTGSLVVLSIVLALGGHILAFTTPVTTQFFSADAYQVMTKAGVSMLDNGTMLSAITMYYERDFSYVDSNLLAGIVALGMYAFLTWLALYFAQQLAIRQGALPPSFVFQYRFKKKKHLAA